eukprot:1637250-Pyramimonas_sp.AAC.1
MATLQQPRARAPRPGGHCEERQGPRQGRPILLGRFARARFPRDAGFGGGNGLEKEDSGPVA